MMFFDKVDRDLNDYVLVLKKRIDVEKEVSKENPIFEVVRQLNQPDKIFFCKIQIKNLKINEGFYGEKEEYISFRVE